MRILFLTLAPFSQYPCYKRAIGTGEALAQKGHQIAIAAFDCPENRERMVKEAPHCTALWFRGNVFSEIFAKIVMTWRWRPDVIYSTSYSVKNLALCRLLLPWRVITVIEFGELYSKFKDKQIRWWIWEKIALLENGHILCASRYLEDYFKQCCANMHLSRSIIYSPYAYPDYLKPIRVSREGRRKIVFMAAMYRGYGAFEVLEAFEQLLKRRSDVELEMIGGGPARREIEEWVKSRKLSDLVHVRGFVREEDLNMYFSSASVFVSPMHDTIQDWARCPSKLFYYLPYNKPIVTCRIGNPYDVLGENGFYYEPLNNDSMTNAMQKAVEVSETFSFPEGFTAKHSWLSRAQQMEEWFLN